MLKNSEEFFNSPMVIKMKKILVTGGTVFVSRYIAEHYVSLGSEVYVLNRNSRPQSRGVKLITADRHSLGDILKKHHFDLIIDTAYTSDDVEMLLNAVGSFGDYLLISSSAVYPEYTKQPFGEEASLGVNKFWGSYGTNKIAAEKTAQRLAPNAYIIRPPYLYGPMNNVYREAFVFDCALKDRSFYLPQSGELKLQFFHIGDLCGFIDIIMKVRPERHIFNVGNPESISVSEWVKLCYGVCGREAAFVNVRSDFEQRNYFSFIDYRYELGVSAQTCLMKNTIDMRKGLEESLAWYMENEEKVSKRPYIEYIDKNLACLR